MTNVCSRFSMVLLFVATCSRVMAAPVDPSPQLFGGLPLNIAIKDVRGNGMRALATFEDPNCIYCRQLAKELAEVTDVTIYTFLYPILSPSSKKTAEAIWCSPDQSKAWSAWMIFSIAPKPSNCDTGSIQKVIALGKSMKLRSVPTIFLANGERYTGGKSKFELEMAISSPKVMIFQSELKNKPN